MTVWWCCYTYFFAANESVSHWLSTIQSSWYLQPVHILHILANTWKWKADAKHFK